MSVQKPIFPCIFPKASNFAGKRKKFAMKKVKLLCGPHLQMKHWWKRTSVHVFPYTLTYFSSTSLIPEQLLISERTEL
jgi:hypothetical protein